MGVQAGRLVGIAIVALALFPVAAGPAATAADERCFAETGHCIREPFLTYWREHGGLAVHGFPLTDPLAQRLTDCQMYVVQYFERSRFELHPENAPPYDILLGQFGRVLYLTDPAQPRANLAPPLPDARYFATTGHNLSGRFRRYWEANGGLAQFGYPLSEELREQLEDGKGYTVQYFERARFELHPENPAPYDVLLGQFGRRILAASAPVAATPYELTSRIAAGYGGSADIRARLGLPTAPAAFPQGALQRFERGLMLWRGDARTIYTLVDQASGGSAPIGAWASYPDLWDEGQPAGGGPAPVPNLWYPQRGFGKVWREHPDLQRALGYATTPDERGQLLGVQPFVGGLALEGADVTEANAFLLYGNGRYEAYVGAFFPRCRDAAP